MLIELINLYGAQLIGLILTIVLGGLGAAVKRLLAQYVDTDTKQALAMTVVMFVEQVYQNLHGNDKLSLAIEALSDQLAAYNITITKSEMRMLIEAAVAEFNAQRG